MINNMQIYVNKTLASGKLNYYYFAKNITQYKTLTLNEQVKLNKIVGIK